MAFGVKSAPITNCNALTAKRKLGRKLGAREQHQNGKLVAKVMANAWQCHPIVIGKTMEITTKNHKMFPHFVRKQKRRWRFRNYPNGFLEKPGTRMPKCGPQSGRLSRMGQKNSFWANSRNYATQGTIRSPFSRNLQCVVGLAFLSPNQKEI